MCYNSNMTRRDFLATGLAAGTLRAQARRPPNIVFFLADDMGTFDLGCYGQKLIQTPRVDRFASEGMRFTDCYAGGAVCAPSRAVLMTGLHTGHAPVRANAGTIPLLPDDVTVAEVLKTSGYVTGGFGKWGLGAAGTAGAPTRQGFDEFFGYLHQMHAHTYYPEHLLDDEEKFPLPGNSNGKRRQYSADLIHERALQFVRTNSEKPFFLYACYTLPHGRYEPPTDEPYSDRKWPRHAKSYAAMVTDLDTKFGQLLDLLRELKLENETIVFFSSDNGGTGAVAKFFTSNGPFRGQKGSVYEGGIRVPMIVRWPGRVAPGVSSFPWSFCDFLPTAADITGATIPAGLDGMSVMPTLLEKKQDPRLLYWEQHTYDRKTGTLRNMQSAARLGEWKAVRPSPTAPLELYNLQEDVGETKNRAAEKPEIARELDALMKSAHSAPRPHNTGTWEYADKT
jgi:arylsulfatase A-like enzyme